MLWVWVMMGVQVVLEVRGLSEAIRDCLRLIFQLYEKYCMLYIYEKLSSPTLSNFRVIFILEAIRGCWRSGLEVG